MAVHRPEVTKTKSGSNRDRIAAVAQELLNFAKTIGTRPDFGRFEGTVDMAPPDGVAGRILAQICEVQEESGSGPSKIAVVYHAAEFEALPTMPVLKWLGEAKRAGFGQFVPAQELVVSEGGLRLASRR
ncbi:hypothetical protein F4776DRAFT_659552 [Hypoxylon sp. NC0597]|nr:hypothetical protein F4776DRAFT_659552 [Hypoxylon sp. NC0597]